MTTVFMRDTPIEWLRRRVDDKTLHRFEVFLGKWKAFKPPVDLVLMRLDGVADSMHIDCWCVDSMVAQHSVERRRDNLHKI